MFRVLLLLPFLAGLGWWVERQQQAGKLQQVDEVFLDFLVGNARDRFEKAAPASSEESPVVWVRMSLANKAEYVGWPPRPLDWQMVFKALQAYEPAVVVVPETLAWGRPSPEFVREAAQALVPLPSTVLGVEARTAEEKNKPAFLGGLEEELPRFQKIRGEVGAVPVLGALITAPDELLRRQADLGIVLDSSPSAPLTTDAARMVQIPYVVQEGGNLRPTLLAQALARISQTPYATQRLVVSSGAGAYLADGGFVPLTDSGHFSLDAGAVAVPEVDALNLMTVELADAVSAADKQKLGRGKVVVIGTDDPATGNVAALHAKALARALAMPRIHLLPQWAEWGVWAVAVLMSCVLVAVTPKRKALVRGALLTFLGLVACFVAFQAQLIWCPPTVPVALLVGATLFCRVFGRKERPVAETQAVA